jgi:hypothetical protein
MRVSGRVHTLWIEQIANVKITMGADKVRPYSNDTGLNNGAVRAKARIAPPDTPARRISRTTGRTPSEQTGNSIPNSQAVGSERHVPSPNRRRV